MSIGVLGDITFESTADKQRTWESASRSGDARWTTHEVYGGKPVSEFLGPGLSKIELSVRLDLNRGVIPRDELRKMREHRDAGSVLQFTVGDQFVGEYVITNVAETWTHLDRGGVLVVAVVSLSLQEYV